MLIPFKQASQGQTRLSRSWIKLFDEKEYFVSPSDDLSPLKNALESKHQGRSKSISMTQILFDLFDPMLEQLNHMNI